MSASVCSEPGCPEIIPIAGRCTTHARARDKARGTRRERGYDAAHDNLRREWAPRVASGTVACARCRKPIRAGQAWHLDHTDDRSSYLGPSHARCNLSAAGVASHRR